MVEVGAVADGDRVGGIGRTHDRDREGLPVVHARRWIDGDGGPFDGTRLAAIDGNEARASTATMPTIAHRPTRPPSHDWFPPLADPAFRRCRGCT